jgi:hypothetical protein
MQVASDCVEVVNGLKGDYFERFSSVVFETKSRSSDFAHVEFVHERRSSNMEAHDLARSSVSHAFSS